MSDEAKLRDQMAAAVAAQSALDTTSAAFELLRNEYRKAWENTGAKDADARERLWLAFQIAGKVESHLKSAVNNGKFAEKALAEIEKFGDPRKARGQV
jgi:hypothetical protein